MEIILVVLTGALVRASVELVSFFQFLLVLSYWQLPSPRFQMRFQQPGKAQLSDISSHICPYRNIN